MSKIERCPHCGEPIEYNSGEAFCTNCGQTVKYVGGDGDSFSQPVEYVSDAGTDSSQTTPRYYSVAEQYKPNKMQTAAGVLMALSGAIYAIFNILWVLFPRIIWDLTTDQYSLFFFIIPQLSFLVGAALLIPKASNKGVRVAAIGFVCLQVLQFLMNAFLNGRDLLPAEAVSCLWILIGFGWVYFTSLVILNSKLSELNMGWVSLLCVLAAINILYSSSFLWKSSFDEALDWGKLSEYDYHVNSFLNTYYFIVIYVLWTICYWKLARCEAFSGKYDAEHNDVFSPLNKWMAMAVIFPLLTGLAFYFYYGTI